MTVKDYLNNAILVQSSILEETAKAVYKNEVEIIKLNTEDQLYTKGVNINGGILGVYSANHQPTSNSLLRGFPKLAGSRYNFLDSGRLFNDMELMVSNNQLTISNTDTGNKLSALYAITGFEFIGLTIENQHVLNYEIIQPELFTFIKKYL
jgi:hypothetical protein